MSRALVVIRSNADRQKAAHWAHIAPYGTRIEFKESKRSIPQNSRMWAMLTDIAQQVPWHGLKLAADDWKLIFLDALKREVRLVPNIDGNGFVSLGRSSSDLSKTEMSDLMELIAEFGTRNGVQFSASDAEQLLAEKEHAA
ncbi:recombination protein NinB [Hyphomicrobium sulfonivorans]|nr:recombination protein NinB [Hyphomicrobium sulfonivorans]